MPSEKWSSISAVRIYSRAACALDAAGTAKFHTAWERSEEARNACDRFRAALLEHEHRHGCQMVRKPAASAIWNLPQP